MGWFAELFLKKPADFSLKPPYICPYCQIELGFIPKGSRKCDKCGQKVFIKYSPMNKQKRLVTSEEKERIDKEWDEYHEKNFESRHKGSLFGEAIIFKHRNEKPELIYKILYQENLEKLLEYKNMGITSVKIMSGSAEQSTCHHCLRNNNRIMNIDDAIKEMPVPNKNCCNMNDGDPNGFVCRCLYEPHKFEGTEL